MKAIDKLIQIATNEIGYLEKETNKNLEDKTANAGDENWTKYWADIGPGYQTQAWCCAFITWCFYKGFGKEKTKEVLKQFPFISCSSLAKLHTKNKTPKVGDIVLFTSNRKFVHSGLVVKVTGNYMDTIEGNTSDAKAIVPNGGAVCRKTYKYTTLESTTAYIRPDYSLLEEPEVEINNEEIFLAVDEYLADKGYVTHEDVKEMLRELLDNLKKSL